MVLGFVAGRTGLDRLGSVYDAPRSARLAWVSYPKPGRLGTDLHRDWLARAVRLYGVEALQHASIDDAWSALLLGPAHDDETDISADADLAWPSTT